MLRFVAKTLSFIGLALTVLPSFWVFSGKIEWDLHARLMLIGMVLWFVFATLSYRFRRS